MLYYYSSSSVVIRNNVIMSVVCDRACGAQLLNFWSNKVMLQYPSLFSLTVP